MNITAIKQIAEKMTFENAVAYIKTLPVTLSCIRDMNTEFLFRVEDHKEIAYISVCYKSLVTGMAQVGFISHT